MYPSPQVHSLPYCQHPQRTGALATLKKLQGHRDHYLFARVLCIPSWDTWIMHAVGHYSIIQSGFPAPKVLCALSLPLLNPSSFSCPQFCLFQTAMELDHSGQPFQVGSCHLVAH